ncbi:hypothetical protein MWU75_12195 [Ornithinimicrobium sp. F0845]|uniref:hypothetical protein n=1 Tax=Ornithinimicrobium sp. F0845 TaxID=2926412 RepID=UPI001FF43BEC|nr:hypothetical protein [Ornithinimicrobium sp. F0845]MCK0112900.1 hypothetical protein [Ornithinimicrobium sp. F0845]
METAWESAAEGAADRAVGSATDSAVETAVVPLRVLDTDVDVVVSGEGAGAFARTVAERWHLAVAALAVGAPAVGAPAEEGPVSVEVELGGGGQGRPDGVLRGTDERSLLQRLTQEVTRAAIHARTGDLLMLHAGALAHPVTGAAVVLVAPGGTGKSTACRVLGPARSYLSDETVGIRRDGTIAPYLKPISTRRPDWAGIKDEVAPSALGLVAPSVPARPAGVVLLRREDGREGEPEVTPLDTLEALTDLAPETSGFMGTDRPLTWLADLLESTGGAVRVTYGAAEDLAPLVDEICGRVP